jgi:DNA-binding transcriptional MocR family regulator
VDLDYLERALETTEVKACLFVPNFSNPLGACMPETNKKRLVEMLARRDIPLVEDDIYGDLHFDSARPRTCKSYDSTGNVLLCSSLSKSLAPGYRVGWCIPGRHQDRVLTLKRTHGVSSTNPTQAAMGQFFANNRPDLHMRHLRKALHTQSLAYIQGIARYFPPDTRVTQPRGGYVLWVEMNRAVHSFELFRSAIEEKISISPGQLFSLDQRYGHCMRISFGLPYTAAIDKALKVLGKLVREAGG